MREYKSYGQEILGKIEANKKVSRLNVQLPEIESWLGTIDQINNMDKEAQIVNGYSFNQFVIPQSFTKLLYPIEVTLTQSRTQVDLLSRGTFDPTKVLSPSDFNDTSRLIAGALKESVVNLTREPATTVAAIEQRLLISDKYVIANQVPFISLPLVNWMAPAYKARFLFDVIITVGKKQIDEHFVWSIGEIIGGRASNGGGNNNPSGKDKFHDGQVPEGTHSPSNDAKSVAENPNQH